MLRLLLAALIPFAGHRALAQTWQEAIRAQAAERDWTPFDRAFAFETVAALKRLAATREHLRFVQAHRIDLQVVAPGEKISRDALGCYVEGDRAMYLNQDELMSGVYELREQGVAEAAIGAALAWKALPTVVHEIRHAMTRERLRRETGLTVRLNPLESEYISFLDETAALRAELAARPELWSDRSKILELEKTNAVVLQLVDRDVGALMRMVDSLYDGKPGLLKTPRDQLVEEYRRRRKALEGEADRLLRLDSGAITDPELLADLEEVALSVADGIKLYREMLAVLEDPGEHAKLKRFYQRELVAAAARAAKR